MPETNAIQKLSIIKTNRPKMALRLTTDSGTQLSARNNSVFLPSWCRKQTNKKLKAQKETQYIYKQKVKFERCCFRRAHNRHSLPTTLG